MPKQYGDQIVNKVLQVLHDIFSRESLFSIESHLYLLQGTNMKYVSNGSSYSLVSSASKSLFEPIVTKLTEIATSLSRCAVHEDAFNWLVQMRHGSIACILNLCPLSH